MKFLFRILLMLITLQVFASCNYFTYTPRSKKNKHRQAPSILIYERIIDFRLEQNSWPVSKEDFISKGMKYYQAMYDCPYNTITFKVVDTNTMTCYFMEHTKDKARHEETQQIDLNSYGAKVKFWKENGKFIWKVQ